MTKKVTQIYMSKKKKKNHERINYKYHKYIQNNNNNIKLLNF